MKVRTAIAGTVLSTRLTAAGCGALTVLASVALSACSSVDVHDDAGHLLPSVPLDRRPPTADRQQRRDAHRVHAVHRRPATVRPRTSPTATVSPTVTASASPSPSASSYPTAAPPTGGGGTAGVQDVLLFGLGGAAIVAGAGSIAYRRKLTRNADYLSGSPAILAGFCPGFGGIDAAKVAAIARKL